MNGIHALIKEAPESSVTLLIYKDTGKDSCLGTRQWALTIPQICQYLDLELLFCPILK